MDKKIEPNEIKPLFIKLSSRTPFTKRIVYMDLKNPLTKGWFFRQYSIRARTRNIIKRKGSPFVLLEVSCAGREADIEEAMKALEWMLLIKYGKEYKRAQSELMDAYNHIKKEPRLRHGVGSAFIVRMKNMRRANLAGKN